MQLHSVLHCRCVRTATSCQQLVRQLACTGIYRRSVNVFRKEQSDRDLSIGLHGKAYWKQAVRLGRRHNMPPPHLDFWPFDLEVGMGVACDLGYSCAKFHLPRPFGFRVRADVRDIRQTDGRTTDADDRLMPRLPYGGGGITRELGRPAAIIWSPSSRVCIYWFTS